MNRFPPVDRQTGYLLPPSLDDWLPEDHLARFIVEVVDRFDISPLESAYAGRGSAAYHPSVLLSLLVYGYATGVFSSRKIERATYDSVAFRFIAAGSHPDHDTLATFRRRFLDELAGLFVQVLEMTHCNSRVYPLPSPWPFINEGMEMVHDKDWAMQEFAGEKVGDARLAKRLIKLADRLGNAPSASIPGGGNGKAETQAAYRLIDQARADKRGLGWEDCKATTAAAVRFGRWCNRHRGGQIT